MSDSKIKKKVIILRVEKESWVMLKKKSIQRELPINAIVKELIDKYLKKAKKTIDNDNY